MTSGSWGSGEPSGEGASDGRGSAGEQPRPDPIGSARVVIGMAAYMLTLLCVAITLITWTVNGVALLGLIFLAVFIWSIGAHRWAFWSR